MKVILIAAELKRSRGTGGGTSLDELWRLAETAGLEPIQKISVRVQAWNPATLVGSGKVEELKALARKHRFHHGGEGGEFESFVLDCPLYKKRVKVEKARKEWHGDWGQYVIERAELAER